MRLLGTRVVLTGATGGLGQALAMDFAHEGAELLLAGRDERRLGEVASRVRDAGGKARTACAHLDAPDEVGDLAKAARDFGAEILVNNAGVNALALFEQQGWPAAAYVLATNLAAPMQLTQALLPRLKGCEAAAVVNIGSAYGSIPFPGFVAYSTAKAGLRAFSQALRRELADSTVKVLHVTPRAIATRLNSAAMNALNAELRSHADRPEVVSRRIVDALLDDATHIEVGMPERLFARINAWAPSLIDRALASKLSIVKRHAT